MTINQLEFFYEIAGCGNYTRAAEKIHVTQPTLSKAIKSLEKEVGSALFVRTREGVRLSETGEKLIIHVKPLIANLRALNRSIYEIQHGLHSIRIGIASGYGYCFIPEMTQKLMGTNIDLNWTESRLEILLASLKSGEIDIALLPENKVDPEIYDAAPFRTVEYIVLTSVKSRLLGREAISPDMLAEERLILFDDTSNAAELFTELEGWEEFAPKNLFLTNQLSTLLELVEWDMGISLVIRDVWEKIHSGALFGTIQLKPRYYQNLVLCWKKNSPKLSHIKKIAKTVV